MKTCLTCGASVADDADVCPDCGMEFESAAASHPASVPGESAGYAVDFATSLAPIPPSRRLFWTRPRLDLANPARQSI